jgi:uncharacterized protein (DUF2384 family)
MSGRVETQRRKVTKLLESVLTRDKVNDLLAIGLSAEEIARAGATSATSIYARRKSDPSRRSELDARIGKLYLVVSEMHARDVADAEVIGWLTSPNLELDAQSPLDCLGRDGFQQVRAAALAWMRDD